MAGRVLLRLARVSFSLCLVSYPLRYRITLIERPLPPVYRDYTDLLLFLPDILLLATLLFWFPSVVLRKKQIRLKPAAFSTLITLLVGLILLSALFAEDRLLSFYYLARTFGLFGLYLFLVNEVRRLDDIALALAIQIFIQSVIGLGQAWQQSSLGLTAIGEHILDPAVSGVSIIGAGDERTLRAYGLADHPNILGGSLAFGLILYLGWIVGRIYHPGFSRSSLFVVLPATAVFASGLATLFLTYSRSAWLAFAVSLLFIFMMLYVRNQKQALVTTAAILATGLILLLPIGIQSLNYVSSRVNIQNSFQAVYYEKYSLDERAALNRAANQIFADHAILGVGPGGYPSAIQREYPDFEYDYQPPHIVLLEAAGETGIFGGLVFAILTVLPWVSMWINRGHLKFKPDLIFASGSLMAVTLVGIFDYYPWLLAPGRYWLWTIWGLWGAFYVLSFREIRDE
ncbi:MAG: O-antigen ligase family protein [Anaerolineales bacterium]|nr:O-antigen ligase family protein [Anaerolineales bacterium]